jgi:acyl-CoA synthetase (AMP-forming)/AMP-acid ligase II
MSGYWRQPQKSAEAFDGDWFKTGDVASYDAQGYIVHQGRQSVDIIKSGGYKISAREIEELIITHPDIEEVAVLGRPDPEWGQRIIAAIVPTHDAPAHTPSQWLATIREHLDGQLAAFKHPKSIIVTERLPRNALGKLQKHLIA